MQGVGAARLYPAHVATMADQQPLHVNDVFRDVLDRSSSLAPLVVLPCAVGEQEENGLPNSKLSKCCYLYVEPESQINSHSNVALCIAIA